MKSGAHILSRAHGSNPHSSFLVIGYGNPLRSDDGVGAKAAAAVEAWNLPDVRTIICHQLTPELAEPIASAQCVIFVDATVEPRDSVELREIEPKASTQIMAHAANPQSLLGLAEALFTRSPSAYWLTIPIKNLAFGEALSPHAQQGLQIALKEIRGLLAAWESHLAVSLA